MYAVTAGIGRLSAESVGSQEAPVWSGIWDSTIRYVLAVRPSGII
jgi:hypothetical protein